MITFGLNTGMRIEDDVLPCGCVIKHEGTQRSSNMTSNNGFYITSRIIYCPLHEIGPELKRAIEWINDT